MGATVTCGKQAGAFLANDGTTIYALFERTYEKNCYPHTPHWSCVATGPYDKVLHRVMLAAGSCEGGMLQSTAGAILPENYIAGWLRALRRPQRLKEHVVDLRFDRDACSFSTSDKEAQVKAIFAAHGEAAWFERIKQQGGKLDLREHTALFLALYGQHGPFSAWRVMSASMLSEETWPETTPTRTATAEPALDLRAFSIDADVRLISIARAPWFIGGPTYAAIDTVIREQLYALELAWPGSAKKGIPLARNIISHAPALPADTKIAIDEGPTGSSRWAFDRLIAQMYASFPVSKESPRLTCGFEDVRAAGQTAVYYLGHLHASQVQWDVPDVEAVQLLDA